MQAPGSSIIEGVVDQVSQSGKYGWCLTPKAREELITKVLPLFDLTGESPGTPAPGTAKAAKATKKSKPSPKTPNTHANEMKAKRHKVPNDDTAKDSTEVKTKRPKPSHEGIAAPTEPKQKKPKSAAGAAKASATGVATKAPRPDKLPRRPHTSTADKPQAGAPATAPKPSVLTQPKARGDARGASASATPASTPPARTPPVAAPKPTPAAKARTAPRPSAAAKQPTPPRSVPPSPVVKPVEEPAAPPAPRTVRRSSPAPPKVPAEALMDQYPPKVAAELLEGVGEEEEGEIVRPQPAWCEPADEGADAEADVRCADAAGGGAVEPASPGSNESEPRHDSEMRGGGGNGGDDGAPARRRTRGQRTPNYCEESDDDFAIDTTPVGRAVAGGAHVVDAGPAAPGQPGRAYAAAAELPSAVTARPQPVTGELGGTAVAAPADQARGAAAAHHHTPDSPPLHLTGTTADGDMDWAPTEQPEVVPQQGVAMRDSDWFREHAEIAASMRSGQSVPALSKTEIPRAYEAYRLLVAEVQAQMEVMEPIAALGDDAVLTAEQQHQLRSFEVNQQYWDDAYLTLAALHERLGHARASAAQ